MPRNVEAYADTILITSLLFVLYVMVNIDPVFAMLWSGASVLITWLNG